MDPAWAGHPAVPVLEAVRHLGEIGAPAAVAAPLLGRILAQEERLGYPFEQIRILADAAYVRTLTEALERMAPGAAVGPVTAPSKEPVPVPAPARRWIFGFRRPI
ncbi:hypothetical protein ACFV30_20575 [Streptomyces sp. NPDC059752]|uniref:hypothetical protein n=1 Tax=unclassified Streptomyces TaxID=2593676 RepID=UPI00365D8C55